jgi:ABC-2 type transport system permease protein
MNIQKKTGTAESIDENTPRGVPSHVGTSPSDALFSLPAYGVPNLGINWIGLRTLYLKEVRRFMKVQLQTVWGPAVTTLLFLAIFSLAMGRGDRTELGVPFADFLAPGLIVMAMIQNAFANSSFSLLVGKVQGTIVDYLMPPLSTAELMAAMTGAAVTRAFMVGFALWLAMLLWPGVSVIPASLPIVLLFGLLGSALVGMIGILTSIWAEKFDHAASVTNFIIAPLSLLSGTFYAIDRLSPTFQIISHANPFFYIISGFRYGFLGRSDSNIVMGAGILIALNIAMAILVYQLLRSGWKLRG